MRARSRARRRAELAFDEPHDPAARCARRSARRARSACGRSPPGCSGSRRCRRRCTCRISIRHAYFTAAQLHAAAALLSRQRLVCWVTTLAQLAALAVYARKGARWARESAAGRSAPGCCSGCSASRSSGRCSCRSASLELWWQRRHQLSSVGYVERDLRQLARARRPVRLPLPRARDRDGLRARSCGDCWWIAAAPAFVGLALLFAFISPYLTADAPAARPALRAAATRLERIEHVGHMPIESRRARRHVAAERRGDRPRSEPARRALGHARRRPLHARARSRS